MEQKQKCSRTIGLLFLIAIVTYATGSELVISMIDHADGLPHTLTNKPTFIIGAILMLANSAAVVVIGIMIFALFETQNKAIALGCLSARIVESILLLMGAISLLSVVSISGEYATTHPLTNYLAAASLLAPKVNFWAFQIAMISLGLGSVAFCWLLIASKRAPKLLAIWDLVGYLLLFVGAILELFGLEYSVLFAIPGGLCAVSVRRGPSVRVSFAHYHWNMNLPFRILLSN